MITGLRGRYLRPMVLALLILASAGGVAGAAETGSVIYSTDFSSDPAWVTNNPYTNHWDGAKGTFHYYLRDATNTFVYKKIPYGGESFRLEYDLFPLKTEFQSSFRFGLGNREMYINQGTTLFSEFENGSYGNIMWLRVIDQANQRREVSSYSQSYGGPSVRFTDGIPYHIVIEYSRELKTASIAVSFLSNGTTLWGYTLASITNLAPMDRLCMSTIGDFENPNAVAEGDMDNLSMRVLLPSTAPGTPAITSPTTMVTGETVVTGGETRTATLTRPTPLTTPVPVTTTKSSPLLTFLAIAGTAGAALLVLASRK
jgi:hypothetical protein